MFHLDAVSNALPIIVLYTALIVGLIKLNEWYYGERKKMTPEEQRREDEENHDRGDW